jgi:penicillin-binding protein 1A
MLSDVPVRITLGPQEEWRPRNADGSFDGRQTLHDAFVYSRNLPLVGVFRELGAGRVISRARDLGVSSPLESVESLGLGASCLAPRELLAVYSVFARSGFVARPTLVTSATGVDGADLVARDGTRVEASPIDRVDAIWRTRAAVSDPVVDRVGAWQIAWLMREAVLLGTAARLRDIGYEAAGKTGTTTAYDALFAGFTARSVAVAWVGTDRNTRALGRHETGGELALPLFADALLPPPYDEPVLAPAPAGIEWAVIDGETGLLAAPGDGGQDMPFRAGTQPIEFATSRVVRDVMQIDRTSTGF